VDVGLLLCDCADFLSLAEALSSVGLIYRGDKGTEEGHLFILESALEVRTHHIHVHFQGAPEWDRYLTFRDRLRASTELREEYGALKRKLAEKYEDDRFAYTAGKTEFVHRVLAGY
jgi:GrpB-like predicted nucleotidyltransferase (UPF0157 family)